MINNNLFDIAINEISYTRMHAQLNQTFHLQDGQAITLVEVKKNEGNSQPTLYKE